jgi:hypothetical protein
MHRERVVRVLVCSQVVPRSPLIIVVLALIVFVLRAQPGTPTRA